MTPGFVYWRCGFRQLYPEIPETRPAEGECGARKAPGGAAKNALTQKCRSAKLRAAGLGMDRECGGSRGWTAGALDDRGEGPDSGRAKDGRRTGEGRERRLRAAVAVEGGLHIGGGEPVVGQRV